MSILRFHRAGNRFGWLIPLALAIVLSTPAESAPDRANVILILADDLGYGELGCFGQEMISTPRLDRMAAEGMRFTSFYAGSTVCAPSRCVLMTGKHAGRARIRGNARLPLHPDDLTVAEVFRAAGYRTALCGKWGLGEEGSTGMPTKQGFDLFFGYLNQHHAHNYYPTFLIRNEDRVALPNIPEQEDAQGGGWAAEPRVWSHDLIMEEALDFIRQAQDGPFFLYLALTVPHANNERTRGVGNGQEVPDYGIYMERDWPEPDKGQAAMITRMDRDVGRVLDLLQELAVAERTLVLFSSDNGPHREGGNRPEFFDANGPLRGMKRDLYEGGIRVPTIAWWPGSVPAGRASDHPAYQGDFFATVCELTGTAMPGGVQSISLLPELLGRPSGQQHHEYLYWEFYERGGRQAVRFGEWKALRGPGFDGNVELYNLDADPGETLDLASGHSELIDRAIGMMDEAHRPDPEWRVR
ncbi:MAG TPA: arylsulfatase [Verrucomicrobiales bacterium]|nr:arylsulfatase [Verrucomicrobiales bacterium]